MAGSLMLIAYLLTQFMMPNAFAGVGVVYLEVLLSMTVTLACSSTLSTLATGGVALGLFGLAFRGGWVEQFGALAHGHTAVNLGSVSSLIMPSEAIWHRASFEMTPALARTLGMSLAGPFITTSVRSLLMVAYGLLRPTETAIPQPY